MTYALLQALVALLLIRGLDLYEREPFTLVAAMAFWGATGAAALAAFGNEVLLRSLSHDVRVVFGAAVFPPLVEEGAKGLALVAAFIVAHWASRHFHTLEVEGPTDGIVYGAAVGLGFAFTEDFFYFVNATYTLGLSSGLDVFVSRRDFFGPTMLHHALFTATFGAALGLATWARGWFARIALPVLGLALAFAMHAVNNGLVELVLVLRYGLADTADWLAQGLGAAEAADLDADAEWAVAFLRVLDYVYIAAFAIAIALWLRQQRRVIREELTDEVGSGLVEPEELAMLPSFWRRSALYRRLLRNGELERWRHLKRIHHELIEFALLKWRLSRTGGDPAKAAMMRRRILAERAAYRAFVHTDPTA